MTANKNSSSVLCGQLCAFHCAKSVFLLKLCLVINILAAQCGRKCIRDSNLLLLSSTVLCGFSWTFSSHIQMRAHIQMHSQVLFIISPLCCAQLLQLCLTLSSPMDLLVCQAPLSLNSPGKNMSGLLFSSRNIFSTKGLNTCLLFPAL